MRGPAAGPPLGAMAWALMTASNIRLRLSRTRPSMSRAPHMAASAAPWLARRARFPRPFNALQRRAVAIPEKPPADGIPVLRVVVGQPGLLELLELAIEAKGLGSAHAAARPAPLPGADLSHSTGLRRHCVQWTELPASSHPAAGGPSDRAPRGLDSIPGKQAGRRPPHCGSLHGRRRAGRPSCGGSGARAGRAAQPGPSGVRPRSVAGRHRRMAQWRTLGGRPPAGATTTSAHLLLPCRGAPAQSPPPVQPAGPAAPAAQPREPRLAPPK